MRPIDADELLKKQYGRGSWIQSMVVNVEDIEEAPTLTYADLVPHAKWYKVYTDEGDGIAVHIGYACPNCNTYSRKMTKFCHECGAKMDGGNEK